MAAATLPRAMTRSAYGWPLYLARTDSAGDEMQIAVPFLAERHGAHWETAAEAGPGAEPLGAGTWAQLLFLSDRDPERMSDLDAIEAADRQLVERRCDLTACAAECAAELAEYPDSCARWDGCVLLAARLCGIEA